MVACEIFIFEENILSTKSADDGVEVAALVGDGMLEILEETLLLAVLIAGICEEALPVAAEDMDISANASSIIDGFLAPLPIADVFLPASAVVAGLGEPVPATDEAVAVGAKICT